VIDHRSRMHRTEITSDQTTTRRLEEKSAPVPASHAPRGVWHVWTVRLALLTVLAVALVVRLIGVNYDYPFLFNPDENGVLLVMSRMLTAHSIDPHWYIYGPLLVYLEALWLAPYMMVEAAQGHSAIPVVSNFNSGTATMSIPFMHVYGRLLFVVVGVGTVWLAYLVGRRLAGATAGLLGATFVALSPLDVYETHFVLPNATTGFFALLTAWWTLRYLEPSVLTPVAVGRPQAPLRSNYVGNWVERWQGPRLNIACAIVSAALGAAVKYNAVVLLLIPLGAVYLGERSKGRSSWLYTCIALCGLAAAVFLLVTPPAVLRPIAFLHGAAYQLKVYAVLGDRGTAGGPSIIWYGRYLVENEGGALVAVAIAGLAIFALRRRRSIDILLLVTVVGYYLLIGVQKVHFERNLLVVLPLLSVAGAYVLVRMAGASRPFGIPASVLLAATIIGSLSVGTVNVDRSLLAPSPQIEVHSWLGAHLPPNSVVVADSDTVPPVNRPDVRTRFIRYPRLTPHDFLRDGLRFVVLARALSYYEGPPTRLRSPDAVMRAIHRDGPIAVFRVSSVGP
jgi:4-amino-4-deoxy-L-arabinose transferase-like glycosyltransferase